MTMNEPEDRSKAADAVYDAARNVWWAGLGLVAVAGEQAGKLVHTLVEKGKQMEPSVSDAVKRAGDQLSDVAEAVGTRVRNAMDRGSDAASSAVDERVANALHRMGFPTKEQVDELKDRIDALTSRLEQFQGRQRPPE